MCLESKRGFTLVEMMVVLTILGLVTAFVLPNVINLYSSIERRTDVEKFISRFNSLGRVAYKQRQGFQLSIDESGELEVEPETGLDIPDWLVVQLENPVIFLDNGLCKGGRIRLLEDNVLLLDAVLNQPYCQIQNE